MMRVLNNEDLGLNVTYIKLEKEYILANEKKIKTPDDAVFAITDAIKDIDREAVCLVTLKANYTPINASIVSIGTLNSSLISPREVMKTAILSNAAAIMIFHNHPSGGAVPSVEDIRMTDRLKQVCDLMGIEFLDHIIIGAASKEWFSFNDKSMINPSEFKFANNLEEINLTEKKNTALFKVVDKVSEPKSIHISRKGRN